jgi:hypothetical protein
MAQDTRRKLYYLLFSLTRSCPLWASLSLSYRPPKSRRELWNMLYMDTHVILQIDVLSVIHVISTKWLASDSFRNYHYDFCCLLLIPSTENLPLRCDSCQDTVSVTFPADDAAWNCLGFSNEQWSYDLLTHLVSGWQWQTHDSLPVDTGPAAPLMWRYICLISHINWSALMHA